MIVVPSTLAGPVMTDLSFETIFLQLGDFSLRWDASITGGIVDNDVTRLARLDSTSPGDAFNRSGMALQVPGRREILNSGSEKAKFIRTIAVQSWAVDSLSYPIAKGSTVAQPPPRHTKLLASMT